MIRPADRDAIHARRLQAQLDQIRQQLIAEAEEALSPQFAPWAPHLPPGLVRAFIGPYGTSSSSHHA